jgi:hypothetical protein
LEVVVLRIYRSDKKNPHTLIGIVEDVINKRKKAFRDYDELWEILISTEGKKKEEQVCNI